MLLAAAQVNTAQVDTAHGLSMTDTITPARKTSPGRRIASAAQMPEVRRELSELIASKFDSGAGRPIWGSGRFTRHIVFGFFEPVSYCGRFVGNISSEPMPTLIGVACPSCIRLWNAAMDVHNIDIETRNERAITELTDRFDSLIGAGDDEAVIALWTEKYNSRLLRIAVRDRLEERGVDLQAVLDAQELKFPIADLVRKPA